jgi:hypothetical protein
MTLFSTQYREARPGSSLIKEEYAFHSRPFRDGCFSMPKNSAETGATL